MITMRVLAPVLGLLGAGALVGGQVAPSHAADVQADAAGRAAVSYPAVPVPAPIPVADAFSWYVRGDLGGTVKSQGRITVDGVPIVTRQYEDFAGSTFMGGIGMGRYITPSLRGEISLDFRNDNRVAQAGSLYTVQRTTTGPTVSSGGTTVQSVDVHTYNVSRADEIRFGSHTALASLYYDIKTGTALTPYVGAGAGVAMHVTKRKYNETATCTASVNTSLLGTVPYVDGSGNPICIPTAPPGGTTQGGKADTTWGPAFALMSGLAYEIKPGVIIDAGYRWIWQGGIPKLTVPAFGSLTGTTTIKGDDRTDHEIRAGVRWNIW